MNGKIDVNGCIQIERAGTFKLMACSKSGHLIDQRVFIPQKKGGTLETTQKVFNRTPCGDFCVHFGEPLYTLIGSEVKLTICKGTLDFENFTDERIKPQPPQDNPNKIQE